MGGRHGLEPIAHDSCIAFHGESYSRQAEEKEAHAHIHPCKSPAPDFKLESLKIRILSSPESVPCPDRPTLKLETVSDERPIGEST